MNTSLMLGEPGTGKTHLLNELVQQGRHPRRRIWVFAPNGGVRGVHCGDTAGFAQRDRWPPVAVFDRGDPLDLIELAVRIGRVTVVVDEVQRLVPADLKRPKRGSALWKVIYEGRHPKVALIAATQFPHEVGACLRKSAHRYVMFRLSDPYELNYVSQRCGAQTAAAVAALPGHDHLVWTPTQGLVS